MVFTAQERRHCENHSSLFTISRSRWIAWTNCIVIHRTTSGQINALGPSNFLNEWESINQLTGFGIVHIEEAITIRLTANTFAIHIKGNELIRTIVIPGIIRRVLIGPNDFASGDIQGHCGARIEIISWTHMAIPWSGVTRTEIG